MGKSFLWWLCKPQQCCSGEIWGSTFQTITGNNVRFVAKRNSHTVQFVRAKLHSHIHDTPFQRGARNAVQLSWLHVSASLVTEWRVRRIIILLHVVSLVRCVRGTPSLFRPHFATTSGDVKTCQGFYRVLTHRHLHRWHLTNDYCSRPRYVLYSAAICSAFF